MATNQNNEVEILKQSMTNWITSLLQVLEMSILRCHPRHQIEGNTHLRTWIYGFLDANNAPFQPFVCHNLVALLQEILVFLTENTSGDEVHEHLSNLNQQMLEVLSNAPIPRILEVAGEHLNDYYGGILNNEELRIHFQEVVALAQLEVQEKPRTMEIVQSARRSGYWNNANAVKERYVLLRRLMMKKLVEFLRKFLDVETAFNDQQN